MAEVKQLPVRIQITDGALIPDKGSRRVRASWKIALFGALALLLFLPLYNMAPVQQFVLGLWGHFFSPLQTFKPSWPSIKAGQYENIWVDILLYLPMDSLSLLR